MTSFPMDEIGDAHEQVLLDLVREGDEYAFTKLVTRYLDPVTRFAFYIAGSHDVAEDIAQSTFVSLWERRGSLGEVRSLKSYLFRMVRNRALDERKAFLVRERYQNAVQAEMQLDISPPYTLDTEEALLRAESVQAALAQLSDRHQLALRLRMEDGMSHAEIGEILGLSPETAQRLSSRALASLRKILRPSSG